MTNPDFFTWLPPNALHQLVETERASLGRLAMKRSGKDFREAYAACRFALDRRASLVRLLSTRQGQPTPDFALIIDGNELWFETTEIDRPNRHRGDEDQFDTAGFRVLNDEEWTTPAALEEIVQRRVSAKATKRYDKCEGLLIWFNAFPVEHIDQINTDWWRRNASSAASSFSEIWVQQSGNFTNLFQ